MAKNLSTLYPGKITVDGNNPNGTFKNRTSDVLKDGTPYEFGWTSDVWGFLSHILGLASVSPSGAEENETNSQYYDAIDGLLGRRKVEFETSRDLSFGVDNATQATATFSRMSLLDSNYIPKFLNNKSLTWDITTDLEPGTSEKVTTDYGCWTDSDENLVLAPDLASVTNSTTAGKLKDSLATFLTDLVHAGDIVYNLDTKLKTTVSVDATLEGEVSLTDDIFTSHPENYKIVKMSPVGIGANGERVGTAFNNSGSDFDDSYYTQIQEPKDYSDLAGDFTVTTGFWTSAKAIIGVTQRNDWTGKGTWYEELNMSGAFASTSNNVYVFTFTGLTFDSTTNFEQAITVSTAIMQTLAADNQVSANADDGASTFRLLVSTPIDPAGIWSFVGKLRSNKKPTFHN